MLLLFFLLGLQALPVLCVLLADCLGLSAVASQEMLCSAECCLLLRRQRPASRALFLLQGPVSVNTDRRESSCRRDSTASVPEHLEFNLLSSLILLWVFLCYP